MNMRNTLIEKVHRRSFVREIFDRYTQHSTQYYTNCWTEYRTRHPSALEMNVWLLWFIFLEWKNYSTWWSKFNNPTESYRNVSNWMEREWRFFCCFFIIIQYFYGIGIWSHHFHLMHWVLYSHHSLCSVFTVQLCQSDEFELNWFRYMFIQYLCFNIFSDGIVAQKGSRHSIEHDLHEQFRVCSPNDDNISFINIKALGSCTIFAEFLPDSFDDEQMKNTQFNSKERNSCMLCMNM